METHSSCKSINMQMYMTLRHPPSMNNTQKNNNLNIAREDQRNVVSHGTYQITPSFCERKEDVVANEKISSSFIYIPDDDQWVI